MSVWTRSLVVAAMLALLAACGGGGGGGGAPDPNLPKQAEVSSDAESAVVPLRAGRYRLSYTTQGGCKPTIRITQQNGDFVYEATPTIRIVFVDDVPNGEFLIEQLNAECEEWTVDLAGV